MPIFRENLLSPSLTTQKQDQHQTPTLIKSSRYSVIHNFYIEYDLLRSDKLVEMEKIVAHSVFLENFM